MTLYFNGAYLSCYTEVFLSSFILMSGSPNSHTYLKRFGLRLYQSNKKPVCDMCEREEDSVSRGYIRKGSAARSCS